MNDKPDLVIQHKSNGEGEYMPCKAVVRKLDAHMIGGRARDSAGEVWSVRKGGDGRYYTTG